MTHPDPSAALPAQPIELDLDPATAASPPPARRRRLPVFIAIGVVVVLLIGAGAYAGYRYLTGGVQPAQHLPASVVAYVGIDLKPGIGQQRKLQALARQLPLLGNTDNPEQAMREFLTKLELDGIDAEKDLASWVGVRAGAAVWLHEDEPYALLSIASRDDKAAAEGLKRIVSKVDSGSVHYSVSNGVALIAVGEVHGKTGKALEAAKNAAKQESFAGSGRFADASRWLSDDHFATAWVDLERLADLVQGFAGSAKESDAILKALESGDMHLQGTAAFGLRATDYGVEGRFRTFGGKHQPAGISDAIAKLGDQPAGSDAAALLSLPDFKDEPAVKKLLEAQKGAGSNGGPLTAAETAELRKLMEKEFSELTEAEQTRAMELFTRTEAGGGKAFADVAGLVNALSGATFIASGKNLRGSPAFQVVAQLADAAYIDNLASLGKQAQEAIGDELKVTSDGNTVTFATSGYAEGAAKLGASADFKTLTAGAPEKVRVAIYLNLDALLTVKEQEKMGPVKAVGVFSGYDGDQAVGSLRVIIG